MLKKLAAIISTAERETNFPKTNVLIFTTEGDTKLWQGRSVKTTNQRKCLLTGCDDWEVSADLPEWDRHSIIIKETRPKLHTTIHSTFTQELVMHGGADYSIRKQNGRSPHLQKTEERIT